MKTLLSTAALLGAVACSGSSDSPTAATSFPLEKPSDSGALSIQVTATPDPPTVGTNSFELTITRTADGSTVDGLTVAVVPYMPSMGHGTSAPPTVIAEGGGKYLVSNVYLFMPGVWELKTTISGAVNDDVEPTFQL
jgi:hypothetical protein